MLRPLFVSISKLNNCSGCICLHQAKLSTSAINLAATKSDEEIAKQRKAIIDKIIRVDHAGELGATYIYKGSF